ncbi:hypothetical protein GX586_05380 [bacterium]|nr:hypothetical protein [bacterium]
MRTARTIGITFLAAALAILALALLAAGVLGLFPKDVISYAVRRAGVGAEVAIRDFSWTRNGAVARDVTLIISGAHVVTARIAAVELRRVTGVYTLVLAGGAVTHWRQAVPGAAAEAGATQGRTALPALPVACDLLVTNVTVDSSEAACAGLMGGTLSLDAHVRPGAATQMFVRATVRGVLASNTVSTVEAHVTREGASGRLSCAGIDLVALARLASLPVEMTHGGAVWSTEFSFPPPPAALTMTLAHAKIVMGAEGIACPPGAITVGRFDATGVFAALPPLPVSALTNAAAILPLVRGIDGAVSIHTRDVAFGIEGDRVITAAVSTATLGCTARRGQTPSCTLRLADGMAGYASFAPAGTQAAAGVSAPFAVRLPVPIELAVSVTNIAAEAYLTKSGQTISGTVALDAVIRPDDATQAVGRVSLTEFTLSNGVCTADVIVTGGRAAAASRWENVSITKLSRMMSQPVASVEGRSRGSAALSVTPGLDPKVDVTDFRVIAGADRIIHQASGIALGRTDATGVFSTVQPVMMSQLSGEGVADALLPRLRGAIALHTKGMKVKDVDMHSVDAEMSVLTGRFDFAASAPRVFNGDLVVTGRLWHAARLETPWPFVYDISARSARLDAGEFCRVFSLRKNHLTGMFEGSITAAGSGTHVSRFDGRLDSVSTGLFYFTEAEKFVEDWGEGLQREIINIMLQRLKQFPYNTCGIQLSYDTEARETLMRLEVTGETDHYVFPVIFHGTWIQALIAASQFQ